MQKDIQLQLALDLGTPLGIPRKLGLQGHSRRYSSEIRFRCCRAESGRVVPVSFRPTQFWQIAIARRRLFKADDSACPTFVV